jgi:hypothetical protein
MEINLTMKDNDVIRFGHNQRVTVEGQVKRPGIFEMKREKLCRSFKFCSGFNEFATLLQMFCKKTAKELKVRDIKSSEFNTYKPQSEMFLE